MLVFEGSGVTRDTEVIIKFANRMIETMQRHEYKGEIKDSSMAHLITCADYNFN